MKKLIVYPLAAALLLGSFCSTCMAQKEKEDAAIIQTWNDYLARIKKQKNLNDPATVKQLIPEDANTKKVREQLSNDPLNYMEKKKKETGIWNEYAPAGKHATGMDLMPLFEEAPTPVAVLSLAGQTDVDSRFDPYLKKVEQKGKELGELSMKDNKLVSVYNKEGEEGLKKRAMAESDRSAIIQQMGGTEKLMNMSEAERKSAAQKMAENVRQNPGLLSGNTDPGMNAMMQKMMSDKEYAKRFNRMSEAEKEAEMKKYMTVQQPDPNFDPEQHDAEQARMKKEINDVKYSQEIILLAGRVQKRLQAVVDQYGQSLKYIEQWKANVSNMIGGWYAAKYKAIPVIELGEYGHDKDPEQVQALDFTYAYLTYYLLQGPEMQLRSGAWTIFKTNCKIAMGEANDFAGTYKWGNKASDQHIFAPDADQQAAGAIGIIYGAMKEVATQAKELTTTAKSYQESFESRINKN